MRFANICFRIRQLFERRPPADRRQGVYGIHTRDKDGEFIHFLVARRPSASGPDKEEDSEP